MPTPKKHYYKGNIHSCCLCANDENSARFTDIFSKTGKEGELLKKIKYVIGIKVKLDVIRFLMAGTSHV